MEKEKEVERGKEGRETRRPRGKEEFMQEKVVFK